MPHIPGHFTPFSQSLINQGMNQTNRLAANATNPPNITNPPNMGNQPYTTFSNNNNMNSGGGNVIGGGGTFNPDTGEGNMGGGSGPDINPNQNPYGTGEAAIPPPEGYASWSDYYQGIAIDPGQMMYDNALDELNEGGFFNEEEIVPPGSWDLNLGGSNLGGAFDFGFGGMTDQVGQNLQISQSGFDLNNDGIVDIFDMQAIDQNNMGSQEYIDFLTSMQNYIQGDIGEGSNPLNDAFQQTLIDAQQEAPTYTGGSMQATPLASGARLAKRLYYPGTTGGFSGMG